MFLLGTRATILVVLITAIANSPTMLPAAVIQIDFEDFPSAFASHTKSGVTFSAVGGGGDIRTKTTPNGTLGIVDWHSPRKELRADIGLGATFVSVDLGDYDADSDRLFLEIFNASNVSLGFTDLVIPGSFVGMKTLSLSAPDISYAVFGARDAANGSSVYADNFRYIPEPGTILLVGVGSLALMRKRRKYQVK